MSIVGARSGPMPLQVRKTPDWVQLARLRARTLPNCVDFSS
jgi:hypothetical protein